MLCEVRQTSPNSLEKTRLSPILHASAMKWTGSKSPTHFSVLVHHTTISCEDPAPMGRKAWWVGQESACLYIPQQFRSTVTTALGLRYAAVYSLLRAEKSLGKRPKLGVTLSWCSPGKVKWHCAPYRWLDCSLTIYPSISMSSIKV